MSETYSDSTEWECPHCGEKSYLEETDWEPKDDEGKPCIVVGFIQCHQCDCYSHIEFDKVISLVARSITKDEFAKVRDEFGIPEDNAAENARLEESVDKDE